MLQGGAGNHVHVHIPSQQESYGLFVIMLQGEAGIHVHVHIPSQ